MPADLGRTPAGTATTQSALGRALLDVNRAAPEVGARIVAVSPDVSSSTNLAGYLLRRHARPAVTICAMGALVPEALAAAERLDATGFGTDVICVTGPDLLFRALQARRGLSGAPEAILDSVFAAGRAAPMVTVLDGHPRTLAFLAGVNQVPAAHLGVTAFGQSGDIDSTYRYHHIDTDSVIGAALDLVD
ncbi:MAG TPA: hypothetical protein VF838_19845 [Trebonia sp.]